MKFRATIYEYRDTNTDMFEWKWVVYGEREWQNRTGYATSKRKAKRMVKRAAKSIMRESEKRREDWEFEID